MSFLKEFEGKNIFSGQCVVTGRNITGIVCACNQDDYTYLQEIRMTNTITPFIISGDYIPIMKDTLKYRFKL